MRGHESTLQCITGHSTKAPFPLYTRHVFMQPCRQPAPALLHSLILWSIGPQPNFPAQARAARTRLDFSLHPLPAHVRIFPPCVRRSICRRTIEIFIRTLARSVFDFSSTTHKRTFTVSLELASTFPLHTQDVYMHLFHRKRPVGTARIHSLGLLTHIRIPPPRVRKHARRGYR